MRSLICIICIGITTLPICANKAYPAQIAEVLPFSEDILVPMSHVEPFVGSDEIDIAPYQPENNSVSLRASVSIDHRLEAGDILVDSRARSLYFATSPTTAIKYSVAVGRPGHAWKGTEKITRKAKWPDWRPPAEMRKRRPDLPPFVKGGPRNPLGARALYLGSTLIRIHGSNEPHTIGSAVSSGCIRMTNEDIMDLYERVSEGSTVVVR